MHKLFWSLVPVHRAALWGNNPRVRPRLRKSAYFQSAEEQVLGDWVDQDVLGVQVAVDEIAVMNLT